MPKFFVLPEKVQDDKITIDTEDVSHITRVLRMSEGEKITVCDSNGFDYECEITELSKNAVFCKILSKTASVSEPKINVTLFQGLPKGQKAEYIIQKTTELGITKIVPVTMSRCVMKFANQKDAEKKIERWRKIAESAAKQSGRGIVPEIAMPVTFKQALEMMKISDLCFAPYECEEQSTLKSTLKSNSSPKSVSFIIGPEGGFDLSEIEQLKMQGIQTITLGKRILRTETAGEAVLSMLMYEYNEI